jgi:hypothetical protein
MTLDQIIGLLVAILVVAGIYGLLWNRRPRTVRLVKPTEPRVKYGAAAGEDLDDGTPTGYDEDGPCPTRPPRAFGERDHRFTASRPLRPVDDDEDDGKGT